MTFRAWIAALLGCSAANAFYHPFQGLIDPPPYLDRSGVLEAGNAFVGVSLSRPSEYGHSDAETLQTAFDLNEVCDRDYEFLIANSDDGWLVGGGEPGPYKLPAADSSHITIMDVGTFDASLGGLSQDAIIEAIESGDILIPQMEVLPTAVRLNPGEPPELELLFDLEPMFPTEKVPLPVNWQLRFVANQLLEYFQFPNQAIPGRFHCSMTRKVAFRSYAKEQQYFKKVKAAIKKWGEAGPQPLVGSDTWKYYYNYVDDDDAVDAGADEYERRNEEEGNNEDDSAYASGVWIYTNRQSRVKYLKPNFIPPYDSDPEKMALIHEVLMVRYLPRLHFFFSPRTVLTWSGLLIAIVGAGVMYYRRRSERVETAKISPLEDDCSTTDHSAGSLLGSPSSLKFTPNKDVAGIVASPTPPMSPLSFVSSASTESEGEIEMEFVGSNSVHFDYSAVE